MEYESQRLRHLSREVARRKLLGEIEIEGGLRDRARGRQRRRAGSNPKASENGSDHFGLIDGCDEPHPATACWTFQNIHLEYTAH